MTIISEDALKLLKEKNYFKEGESTWEDIANRVAKAIASPEEKQEKKEEIEQEVYDSISSLEFIFSTPVLLNADAEEPGQLSSCFICQTRDTIEDICALDAEFAKIFQKNGGAGTDLSVLRPSKTNVGSSKAYAGGVIAFMEKYDATADTMTRHNPSRKGALKINLQCWHPQIIEFCKCKEDLTKLTRMNISVSLTDEFMQAVENDKDWDLVFPDYEKCKDAYDREWNGDIESWKEKQYPIKIYQTIRARDLLKLIAEQSYKSGDPGINYQSTMNKDNPNKHISKLIYTNPCSEFTNIPGASCNLGSFNLTKFVSNSKFDFDKLKNKVCQSVRWFDNMITINKLPLENINKITKDIRPIGEGFMGMADAMYMLGIKYNSPEGLSFAEKIAKTMKESLTEASVDLAKERGVYPKWQGSEWQKKNIKIRNSSLMSIAPNGSIAFIAGVSGGIEPNFGLCYTRRTYDGVLYYVINPIFKKKLEELGIYSDELIEKISKNRGSCQGIKEIPKEVQDVFVIASDLTPEEHTDMVSIVQQYVDLSLSKTINFANKATIKDIYDIIVYAWKKKLKGLTVYRDGCRENQVLTTDATYAGKAQEPEKEYDYITPHSKDELGETYGSNIKRKVACGNLYINFCRDEHGNLVEGFVNIGKGGICQSNINAVSRLISLALRSGIKVEEITDQLQGIKCPACTILKAQGKEVGASCPDSIAKYLQEKYEQGNIVIKETKVKGKKPQEKDAKMTCNNCGEKMRMEAGCVICDNCGSSKCG